MRALSLCVLLLGLLLTTHAAPAPPTLQHGKGNSKTRWEKRETLGRTTDGEIHSHGRTGYRDPGPMESPQQTGQIETLQSLLSNPEKHGSSDMKCPLTVKILDAVNGTPAGPMTLKVFRRGTDDTWAHVASGMTEESGEIHNLITEEQFTAGVYKVEFGTKAYWKSKNVTAFHEVADVVFEAHADGHHHYTLALLLSPFSFTTTALTMDANH
uniref:Transthyretin n=1 Tax=Neogobius melanostomus TaxID=47308 RepID=A0A8C6UX09_9GOBI